MFSCILPLFAGRIFFRCFGMSYFVCIVLLCLGIILVFLLLPVSSGLFLHVVCFSPNLFQLSSSILSFLLLVVGFFSAFPVEFPIQVLSFCSCFFFIGTPIFSLTNFALAWISLFKSEMLFVEICVNNSFFPFLIWLFYGLGFLPMVIHVCHLVI